MRTGDRYKDVNKYEHPAGEGERGREGERERGGEREGERERGREREGEGEIDVCFRVQALPLQRLKSQQIPTALMFRILLFFCVVLCFF